MNKKSFKTGIDSMIKNLKQIKKDTTKEFENNEVYEHFLFNVDYRIRNFLYLNRKNEDNDYKTILTNDRINHFSFELINELFNVCFADIKETVNYYNEYLKNEFLNFNSEVFFERLNNFQDINVNINVINEILFKYTFELIQEIYFNSKNYTESYKNKIQEKLENLYHKTLLLNYCEINILIDDINLNSKASLVKSIDKILKNNGEVK